MMKKMIALGVCLVVMSTAAFAQVKLSAGAGGLFQALWSTTKSGDSSETESTTGGGFFGFFDATYAEVDLGLVFDSVDIMGSKMSLTSFTLGLVGKYPIALGESLTVFPLAGFDYNIFLSGKSGEQTISRSDLSDAFGDDYIGTFDVFNIVIGGGVDYSITPNLFIRGEVRWGFKLPSKLEQDMLDASSDLSIFTHGPKISLAVGYAF
jgi:opacity protein-like surface antigen